jgi:hypothetical protein
MSDSTTPQDGKAMPPASAGSQPVAWEVMLPGVGKYDILSFQWEADAIADGLREREGIKALALPLYRQPQPTLTDEEREFLQALRDAYQEMANQTGSVNAAVQADSRKNAAIIRGLLERTK